MGTLNSGDVGLVWFELLGRCWFIEGDVGHTGTAQRGGLGNTMGTLNSGDGGLVWLSYSGDAGLVWLGYSGDAGLVWTRYSGDVGLV